MDRGRKRGCGANELPACGIGITPAFLTCQHLVVAVTTKHFKVQSEALLGSSVLMFSSVAGEGPCWRKPRDSRLRRSLDGSAQRPCVSGYLCRNRNPRKCEPQNLSAQVVVYRHRRQAAAQIAVAQA